MVNKEVKRPSILLKGTDIPSQSYSLEDYLDPEKLGTEQNRVDDELQKASSKFYEHASVADYKSQAEWHTLEEKPQQLTNAFLSLHQRIKDNPQGQTANGVSFASVLFTAHALLIHKTLEQQKKIAKKHDFLYFFEPLHQLKEFIFTEDIRIKLGNSSILDIVNNLNLAPSSVFRLVMEAYFVRNRKTHTKILAENQTPLTKAYPNITKQQIQLACGQAMALFNTGPTDLDLFFREFLKEGLQGTDKEIAQAAKDIVKRTLNLRTKIFHAILNPTSSEFLPLRQLVEKYLEDESEIKTMAILRLGLNNHNAISYAYRTVKELAKLNDDNSLFYTRLASSIRDFVEEFPSTTILTKDDLSTIIDANYTIGTSLPPSPEDLRRVVGLIFQNSSKREYDVEPEKINWGNLVSPTLVRVEFLKDTPNKFNLLLHYQNEEDDMLDLPLVFDTKQGGFNWTFMESPDDQDMEGIARTLIFVVQSILSDVQKQAEAEYREKQKARIAKSTFTTKASATKGADKTEWTPKEKEEKQKKPKPLTPIQQMLAQDISVPLEKGAKKFVAQPEERDLKDMMQGISFDNQNMIIEGINRFNDRGAGRFKSLTYVQHEGKSVWELRLGNFRALVTEAPIQNGDSQNKKQTFEIYKISHRKDTFLGRKWQ